MPFYTINGMHVHIKFGGRKKAPAPCVARVGIEGGSDATRRCCDISGFLCDFPVATAAGDTGTCDAPLCDAHAHQVGRNRHYCPRHHAEHTHQAPQLTLFTDLEKV